MKKLTRKRRRRFIAIGFAVTGAAMALGLTAGAAADRGDSSSSQTKSAYLVIYRPGPAWEAGAPIASLPLKEHGRYMLELYNRGAMRSAGPFADDSGAAVVLDADDEASARSLVEADPAVRARLFRFELHRWKLVPWDEIVKRRAASSD